MQKFEGPGDYPVRDVKLGEKSRVKLEEYLSKETEQALADRKDLEEDWKFWNEQMNNRVKAAVPGASELDLGLTAERAQQVRARILNPIYQYGQIFTCKPRESNESFANAASTAERVLDFSVDRIDIRSLCNEWFEQAQTVSCGVIKTPFVTEKTTVRVWEELFGNEEYNAADIFAEMSNDPTNVLAEVEQPYGTQYFAEGEREVIKRRGVFPEVIPIEDFIFPFGASNIDTSPWVTHRIYLTKSDVKCRIEEGLWTDKIKDSEGNSVPTLDILGDPSKKREPLMRPGKDKETSSRKFFEIHETYISWDLEDDETGAGQEELIVWWDRSSGAILRIVHNFYQSYPRPFITWAYKPIIGHIYGQPLTQILEPLHHAYSACVNQRLEAASRANEVLTFINENVATASLKRTLSEGTVVSGIHFISGIPKDNVATFNISQPFQQLPDLEEKIGMHADKRTGMSDEAFGIQSIERPTATGQVRLLEEGKQPLYLLLDSFRTALSVVGAHMLARLRQFYPAGMELYGQLTQGGESVFAEWPKEAWEESIVVETKVSSQSMNKQLRKEEAVATLDKMSEMYEKIMKLADAAVSASPLSMVAAKVLAGLQTAIDVMMEEMDVVRRDLINPDLSQDINVGQNYQQTVNDLQQRLAQAEGTLNQIFSQGAGPGGPMGAPPSPNGPGQGPPPMAGPPQGQLPS